MQIITINKKGLKLSASLIINATQKEKAFISSTNLAPSTISVKVIGEVKKMVLFCAAGFRSALATKSLVDMGFKNVAHVDGGFDALKNVGMKVIEKEKK